VSKCVAGLRITTFYNVAMRTNEVRKSARLRFKERNAHMKGVTLALRLALGLPHKDRRGQPLIDRQMEQVTFTISRQG
jgi:hypothetical protein